MSFLITLVTFIYLFIYLLLLLLLPLFIFFWEGGGSVFLFVIPKCSELQNVHEIA